MRPRHRARIARAGAGINTARFKGARPKLKWQNSHRRSPVQQAFRVHPRALPRLRQRRSRHLAQMDQRGGNRSARRTARTESSHHGSDLRVAAGRLFCRSRIGRRTPGVRSRGTGQQAVLECKTDVRNRRSDAENYRRAAGVTVLPQAPRPRCSTAKHQSHTRGSAWRDHL